MVSGNQVFEDRMSKISSFADGLHNKFLQDAIESDPQDPCCHTCTEPQEKYHSVDHMFNNCGEACMDPKHYWIFKIFEPGLEKSETNTPCADRNYTDYKNTPTHGVFPFSLTLDLYAPTPKSTLQSEPVAEEIPEDLE
jgi:hypothetical protein